MQTRAINKEQSGFPEHMDFQFLRQKGIEHLASLSGNLWSDHNVHDPGVTILENLVYALLDLGYASSHKFEDLIALKPKEKVEAKNEIATLAKPKYQKEASCFGDEVKVDARDNNFYSASEILGNNPLTILDYRKLLIDQPGVRNAWLEVEQKAVDICRKEADQNCPTYLNGLYHVYIDLDKQTQYQYDNDPKWQEKFENGLRDVLMSHRNFCEDFLDITFLCKKEIGFCADIELKPNANLEEVFNEIIDKLRHQITPVPQHYSLKQLLDRKRSMEKVFEGRPIDLKRSHGFLDVLELNQIKLIKELRRSDIYKLLLGVQNVDSVKKLTFRDCDGNITDSWKYAIPENHIPEFSLKCSGFRFIQQGVPMVYELDKFLHTFQITGPGAPILHHANSTHLNPEIPVGNYKEDLEVYYSIQNEFPKVYGIQEGGLGPNVSKLRQAQAYQLKGYLLFFDQLLANYLSQLQNIRSLFALYSENQGQHTYFVNKLDSVPDLSELLRFRIDENSKAQNTDLGDNLMFPVDRQQFEKWVAADHLKNLKPIEIPHFEFATGTERDIAVQNLINDLNYQDPEPQFVQTIGKCHYYYLLGTSQQVVYISHNHFSTEQEAKQHSENIKFIGTFQENYRSYQTKKGHYSFLLEYHLSTNLTYLQRITEDQDLFYKRRHAFLNHLLSRFSEKFTDYALLSYGTFEQDTIFKNSISLKERLLKQYPTISSKRGKGYNYYSNRWENKNVSGFETRFKALAGIRKMKKLDLCHFEVDEYEKNYILHLKIGAQIQIRSKSVFSSRNGTLNHARRLFQSLSKKENYEVIETPLDGEYRVQICYTEADLAELSSSFSEESEAWSYVGYLHRMFTVVPLQGDTVVSKNVYRVQLVDFKGNNQREYQTGFDDVKEALSISKKAISQINDPQIWRWPKTSKKRFRKLVYGKNKKGLTSYVEVDQFKIDVNDTIVGKPGAFTFSLLDKNNSYKLNSTKEYVSSGQARMGCYRLLFHLINPSVYRIEKGDNGRLITIIHDGKKTLAQSSVDFTSKKEVIAYQKGIQDSVSPHCYDLLIDEEPTHWKFRYFLSNGRDEQFEFRSVKEFASVKQALNTGRQFALGIDKARLAISKGSLLIVPAKKGALSWCRLFGYDGAGSGELREIKEKTTTYFSQRQEILPFYKAKTEKPFERFIDLDPASKMGTFVYRLVDNNRIVVKSKEIFGTEQEARAYRKRLFKLELKGYGFLEICLGGEIVVKRKDERSKKTLYYYQIKSRNACYSKGQYKGKPIVLFEGTRGFESKEQAEKAFQKHYLEIFYWAHKRKHYGKDRKIELAEVRYDDDPCNQKSAVAFVPQHTLDELGGHDERAIQTIIRLVRSYPIVYHGPKNYRIRLIHPVSSGVIWRGSRKYTSVKKARSAFEFLKVLLKYTGNYAIVRDPDCKYRIHIREVLAESIQRFQESSDAWKALEQFINLAQRGDRIYSEMNAKTDCYSNFYACESEIFHPCEYHSEQERDRVIDKLYSAARAFNPINLIQIEAVGGQFYIRSLKNERIGILVTDPGKMPETYCHTLFTLVEVALNHKNYRQSSQGIWLVDNANRKILSPADSEISLECWKELLFGWAYYFPMSRRKIKDNYSYCLEIRLPGFNDFRAALNDTGSCACEEEGENPEEICYLAWKSRCCYESCKLALDHFNLALRLITNRNNYRPVFECECGPFGLVLIPEDAIIAKNPQCYPSPKMACKAKDRALAKINCEGLHVVEHILLRPRCSEDCKCDGYTKTCDNETECKFDWKQINDDPCQEDISGCFIPGRDPYSFIATVILPAWPKRFRSDENKELVERLLRQEAPAHVLLRVLWLRPEDFYLFETSFKKWNRYLAKKTYCDDNEIVNCQLINLILYNEFQCMDESDNCINCLEEEALPVPCEEDAGGNIQREEAIPARSYHLNEFANQVNKLFCWQIQECSEEFEEKTGAREHLLKKDKLVPRLQTSEIKQPKILTDSQQVQKLSTVSSEKSVSKPIVRKKKDKGKRIYLVDFYNSRRSSRAKEIETIVEQTNKNDNALRTHRFVQRRLPRQDELCKVLEDLLSNQKTNTTSKLLNKVQLQQLVEKSVSFFMDKTSYESKRLIQTKRWKSVLQKLEEKGISLQKIYRNWDSQAVEKAHEKINIDRFKNWFNLS